MEAARGIIDIVNENMFGALRMISVQQGYDPREFALMGFGGAGPLHVNAVARLINETQHLDLHDYRTGDVIRKATDDEAGESINAGDEGVITVDGQRCYVA